MKKFRRYFIALSLLLLLVNSGCAQSGTPVQNATVLAAQNARIREVGEAMEGGGWNVYGNGFLGDWFQTPRAGKIAIKVIAAGDSSADIFPVVRLWVNEKLLQTFAVDSIGYQEYSFAASVPAGATRIEIEFTNDTNGETPDRNLRVMSITVSDSILAPAVPKIGEAEIAKYRMGTLAIKGKPGVRVKVTQLRHEFAFGTALNHQLFEPRPAAEKLSDEDRKMFGIDQLPPDSRTEADRQKYLEIARTWFNAGVHGNALKWYHTEKRQGELNYADADRVLQWAEKNDIKMRGHTLFWAMEKYVQDWVKELDNLSLEAKMKEHAREVATRYQGRIDEWDVNNEMLHGDFYEKRLGVQINAESFKWARAANPNAVLYVNDYAVLSGSNADAYFNQIKALQDAGAPVGGVGFQGHFGYGIDLRHVKRTLDQFATLKLPLKVTEFDLKTGNPEMKAKQMTDFYRTCFAHPAIEGITMWGFWQGSHWIPEAALFARDWTPTLAAKAYHDLVFKEWWTNQEAVIPQAGVLHLRAFYGRHEIVERNNKIIVELPKKKGIAYATLK